MMPRVSAVVVNFNAGEHLSRCLDSFEAHLAAYDWDAVIVDNASSDGSAMLAVGRSDRVRLLQQDSNLGFGKAINLGVAATAGEWVLLLNPDGRLEAGSVERMLVELEQHPDCAVVGPRVLDEDGTTQGSARGDPDMLTGVFGRSTWLTRWFPRAGFARKNVRTQAEPAVGETSVEVDWVSGACMLVRRRAFEQVGGFDERFFLYWEDADLCRRLRQAGYRTRYCAGARVTHAVGRSSSTAPALAIRAFHASAYLYYTTHVAPSRWNPKRWAAFFLLRARCWLKLASRA